MTLVEAARQTAQHFEARHAEQLARAARSSARFELIIHASEGAADALHGATVLSIIVALEHGVHARAVLEGAMDRIGVARQVALAWDAALCEVGR